MTIPQLLNLVFDMKVRRAELNVWLLVLSASWFNKGIPTPSNFSHP